MKEYWIIWSTEGDPIGLTLSDTTAQMFAEEGKIFSPLLEEEEWFQDWAEHSLTVY
jgi:hypothetical protein